MDHQVPRRKLSRRQQILREGQKIPKSSRISTLSPVLVDEVICVKTRLCNSPHIQNSAKYPAILDPNHTWTKILVDLYHSVHGHVGVDKVLNELRQRYWVLGGRAPVKLAARVCLKCRMNNAKPIIPEMAALPEVRVKMPSRAFSYTGVDYFGPVDVVVRRLREKRYVVLFTCLSTRAVHLEVAHSLSTDDYMMAFHRFVCRRGVGVEVWSDNGTNFRGADKEIKKCLLELDQEKIGKRLATLAIKWNFIPPGAPHMGGAWEILVRSVKTAMSGILGNRTLNDQLLLTVLAEAEASVNTRPITAVSSDLNDDEAITPNCFLIGTTSIQQPPGGFDDGYLSLRKRWRHGQVLANHFWRRWVKECLPSLALRGKWNQQVPEIEVGEIVFVADMNALRNQWTKGIVETVYPGQGGCVRVVDVRTAKAVINRPVSKLYRIRGINEERDSEQ